MNVKKSEHFNISFNDNSFCLWVFLFIIIQLVAHPIFSQQNDYVNTCIVLAQKYETEGKYKEATEQLNSAAMQVWETRNYEKAIQYFNKSIELNALIDNQSGIAKLKSNLGMIYSDLGQYQKSLDHFQMALDYRLQNGQKTEIISTYINQAVVLNNLKKYNDATDALERALGIATEMSDALQMKSCYGMLAETYEKAGNQERTIHYFNLYRTFHEMIQRQKLDRAKQEIESTKLRLLQTELDKKNEELALIKTTEKLQNKTNELEEMDVKVRDLVQNQSKQELANSLLKRQIEINDLKIAEANSKNNIQKGWNIIIIIGLASALLVIVLITRNYWLKQKINKQLSSKNEEIISVNNSLESEVAKRTTELEEVLKNLRKRNTDLDQFSHVIAHNLRGPVARILGLGNIINIENPSDPMNLEIFRRLIDSVQNLDDVVNDLSTILDIKDNYELQKEPIDVQKSIKQVEGLLGEEIAGTHYKIIKDVKVDTVFGVKSYVESILYNLISNAVKYSKQLENPEIFLSISNGSESYKLVVKDKGIGIRPDHFTKIFEPYNRLTLEGKGKGLGLYLVKTQVEAMGGTVTVASELGMGSEFKVEIPISKTI